MRRSHPGRGTMESMHRSVPFLWDEKAATKVFLVQAPRILDLVTEDKEPQASCPAHRDSEAAGLTPTYLGEIG